MSVVSAIAGSLPTPSATEGRKRSGYLPGLDGWRALAILAVLMSHDQPWSVAGYANTRWRGYGGWGVELFFAISGFLICTRILEEEALLGSFHLRRFYIRRLLRIQPAALVYLATVALLTAFHITHERPAALFGALFLYQNYQFNTAHNATWALTGHFWTLSVEEHFYLLLSLLLFTVMARRAAVLAALLAALFLWYRFAIHLRLYSPFTSVRHTELNLQYLLFPALLAVLLRRKAALDLARHWLHPWAVFLITFVAELIGLARNAPTGTLADFFFALLTRSPAILFYAFSFWIVGSTLHPRSWTTSFLELAPLRFLGRLSYSLYLWHVLFFIGADPGLGIHVPWLLLLTGRPWRYPATFALALASFYFVEKPLIRLGHSLAPPATPGHRDLEFTHPDPTLDTTSVSEAT